MASPPESVMREVEKTVSENPDAVVTLLDSKGLYRYISPSVTALLGYSQQDIQDAIGTYFTGYTHSGDITHIELRREDAMLNDESILSTRRTKLKSGGYRRMRGLARKLISQETGEVYLLQIGRPEIDTRA